MASMNKFPCSNSSTAAHRLKSNSAVTIINTLESGELSKVTCHDDEDITRLAPSERGFRGVIRNCRTFVTSPTSAINSNIDGDHGEVDARLFLSDENINSSPPVVGLAYLPHTWPNASAAGLLAASLIPHLAIYPTTSFPGQLLARFLAIVCFILQALIKVPAVDLCSGPNNGNSLPFSSQHLLSRCSSLLLLAVGRLVASEAGETCLINSGLYAVMHSLLLPNKTTTHTPKEAKQKRDGDGDAGLILEDRGEYVSISTSRRLLEAQIVLVSSLQLANPNRQLGRQLLSAAAHGTSRKLKIYLLRLIRLLLRLRVPSFISWVVHLLVKLCCESHRRVTRLALGVLEHLNLAYALEMDTLLLSLHTGYQPSILFSGWIVDSISATERGRLQSRFNEFYRRASKHVSLCTALPPGQMHETTDSDDSTQSDYNSYRLNSADYDETVSTWLNPGDCDLQNRLPSALSTEASGTWLMTDDLRVGVAWTVTTSGTVLQLPRHLYGCLAAHKPGFQLLLARGELQTAALTLTKANVTAVETVPSILPISPSSLLRSHTLSASGNPSSLQVNAALWVIGHVGSSACGFQWVADSPGLLQLIRTLALFADCVGIRATAWLTLNLLASGPLGSSAVIPETHSAELLPLGFNKITWFTDAPSHGERDVLHRRLDSTLSGEAILPLKSTDEGQIGAGYNYPPAMLTFTGLTKRNLSFHATNSIVTPKRHTSSTLRQALSNRNLTLASTLFTPKWLSKFKRSRRVNSVSVEIASLNSLTGKSPNRLHHPPLECLSTNRECTTSLKPLVTAASTEQIVTGQSSSHLVTVEASHSPVLSHGPIGSTPMLHLTGVKPSTANALGIAGKSSGVVYSSASWTHGDFVSSYRAFQSKWFADHWNPSSPLGSHSVNHPVCLQVPVTTSRCTIICLPSDARMLAKDYCASTPTTTTFRDFSRAANDGQRLTRFVSVAAATRATLSSLDNIPNVKQTTPGNEDARVSHNLLSPATCPTQSTLENQLFTLDCILASLDSISSVQGDPPNRQQLSPGNSDSAIVNRYPLPPENDLNSPAAPFEFINSCYLRRRSSDRACSSGFPSCSVASGCLSSFCRHSTDTDFPAGQDVQRQPEQLHQVAWLDELVDCITGLLSNVKSVIEVHLANLRHLIAAAQKDQHRQLDTGDYGRLPLFNACGYSKVAHLLATHTFPLHVRVHVQSAFLGLFIPELLTDAELAVDRLDQAIETALKQK